MSDHYDGSILGLLMILVILVVLVITMIITAIVDGVKTKNFDRSFSSGQFSIEASYVELGKNGVPETSVLPEWIPEGGDQLDSSPRIYDIKGCESYALPEQSGGVYAATTFYQPSLVEISVPAQSTGTVNVCVPQGTQIEVVLWAR